MNKEVVKAMRKEVKVTERISKWWNKNGYKVMRVVLFPVYLGILAKEKIEKYLDSKQVWNEEKANEILNYYIPRRAEWDSEDNSFYFFDNGYGWGRPFIKRFVKRKDRRFWKVNANSWSGGKIRDYLVDTYELEGFKKEILDASGSRTEIIFRLIENGVDK